MQALNLLLGELQKVHRDLFFEFAADTDGSEVVISADGDQSLSALVDAIVALAPEMPGWSVHALKPKLGFPLSIRWEGLTVSISDVAFDPLESLVDPALGLRMFVRGLAEVDVEDAHNALLRAIDHGLGERAFAEEVNHTEVHHVVQDVDWDELIPLACLEEYIEWRKGRSPQ